VRRVLRRIFLLLAVVLVAASAAFLWGMRELERQGPLATETTIILPRGIGLEGIARQLAEAGILDRPWLFLLAARLSDSARHLRAGEYAFPAGISAIGAMKLLLSGRTVVRRLTVPEGVTTSQVLDLVAATEGLFGEVGRVPDEGALLPETYHFSYGDRRGDMVARMAAAMKSVLRDLWDGRAGDLPFSTRHEALVLASIVEKETALPEERPHIAGVFVNRLRRGMRLQSDPTVVYALTRGAGPLDRPLTRADLEIASPYNTYRVSGLPPTPIANPGRAAIAAALNPLVTNDLYFVANGSGGHVFARTLGEHNRNVALWRRLRTERKDAAE
jgi:UPF0755 protein